MNKGLSEKMNSEVDPIDEWSLLQKAEMLHEIVEDSIDQNRLNVESLINPKEILDLNSLKNNLTKVFDDKFTDFDIKDLNGGCIESFEIQGVLEKFEREFKEKVSQDSMMIKAMVVLQNMSTEEVLDYIIEDIVMSDVEKYFSFVIGSTVHEFQKQHYPTIEFEEFQEVLFDKYPSAEYVSKEIHQLFHNSADEIIEELKNKLKDTIRINKDNKMKEKTNIVIDQEMETILKNRFQAYIDSLKDKKVEYIPFYLLENSTTDIILECFDFEDILPGIKEDITSKTKILSPNPNDKENDSIIKIRGELYNNQNYNRLASMFMDKILIQIDEGDISNRHLAILTIRIEKILPFLDINQLFEYLEFFDKQSNYDIKGIILEELNNKIAIVNTDKTDNSDKLTNKYNDNLLFISSKLNELSKIAEDKSTTEKLQFISLLRDLTVLLTRDTNKQSLRYSSNITKNLANFIFESSNNHFVKYFALSSNKEILSKSRNIDLNRNYKSFQELSTEEWFEKIEEMKKDRIKMSTKIEEKMGSPEYIGSGKEKISTLHYDPVKISKDYYGFEQIDYFKRDEGIKFIGKISDNPKEIDVKAIQGLQNDSKLNPFSENTSDDFFQLIRYLHLPRVKYLIEEDLGIKLVNLELKTQIHLLRFLEDKDSSSFDRLKNILQNNPNNRENILKSFLACAKNREFGDELLELAEDPNAKAIFEEYSKIIDIIKEKEEQFIELGRRNDGINFDTKKFSKSIYKRAFTLLEKAAKNTDVTAYKKLLEDTKEFHADVVEWGALFSSLIKDKAGKLTNPELLSEIFSSIQIDLMSGSNIIKANDRESMNKEDNYLNPEKFSLTDYKMIVENLRTAYSKIDPGWLEHLIDNIPQDIVNPNVDFMLLRNQSRKLIGLCKSKRISEDEYYFGTFYVENEFQKGFGIGGYIDNYMRSRVPKNANIKATVAASNTAAIRHIDLANCIGTDITFEGQGDKISNPLIELNLNPIDKYVAKSNKYTKERIMILANMSNENDSDLICFKKDTSNSSYTEGLKPYFKSGFVITRMFFDPKTNSQKDTYIVLERDTSKENRKILAA